MRLTRILYDTFPGGSVTKITATTMKRVGVLLTLACSAAAFAGDLRIIHEGWTDEVAKAFWAQDQGSELMPWSWFANLEAADGNGLFTARLESFGFIPKPEGGLPIGIAKHTDK